MCANSMWRPPPESAPSPPRRAGCGSVSVRAVSGERDLVGRPAEREGAGPANDSAGPWTRRQGFALGLPTAHTGVGFRTMHTHHTHTHTLGHCLCLRNGPSLCLSHHLYCPNTEEAYPGQRNAVAYCHAVHA